MSFVRESTSRILLLNQPVQKRARIMRCRFISDRRRKRLRLFCTTFLLSLFLLCSSSITLADEWFYDDELLVAATDSALEQFGSSVAISTNLAVVGAPYAFNDGVQSGAAYVFTRYESYLEPGEWVQTARLVPSDGADDDLFGYAVAITSNNTIVIGASRDDDNGLDSGAIYLFDRAGPWYERAKLKAADGQAGDRFGSSVAVTGETIVVGAPFAATGNVKSGAAYVFEPNEQAWAQQTKLVPDDPTADAEFGRAVDVDEDVVLVGAPFQTVDGIDSGAAYVFERADNGWLQKAQFVSEDAASGDYFGTSVALTPYAYYPIGNRRMAFIGAPGDDDNGLQSGAVYRFRSSEPQFWWQITKLTASDGTAGDRFGFSIDADIVLLVVGALPSDGSAAAYRFIYRGWAGPGWLEDGKFETGSNEDGRQYGRAVATDARFVVVGAPLDDSQGTEAGATHIFRVLFYPTAVTVQTVEATTDTVPFAVVGVLIAGAFSLCWLLFGRIRPQMLQSDV